MQQGTLILDGGGDSTGAFTAAAGATLSFDGGKFNLLAGSAVNGAGTVKTQGNAANVNDVLTVSGTYTPANTLIRGGTLRYMGVRSVPALTLAAGNVETSEVLTVLGRFEWPGGQMQGGGQFVAQGSLAIGGDRGWRIQNATLVNAATATWQAGARVETRQDGKIVNRLGARMYFNNDVNATDALFGVGSFENAGELHKTGSQRMSMQVPFRNTGQIFVEAGVLALSAGSDNAGSFDVAAGSTIVFEGGEHHLAADSSVTGDGRVSVGSGLLRVEGVYVPRETEIRPTRAPTTCASPAVPIALPTSATIRSAAAPHPPRRRVRPVRVPDL